MLYFSSIPVGYDDFFDPEIVGVATDSTAVVASRPAGETRGVVGLELEAFKAWLVGEMKRCKT